MIEPGSGAARGTESDRAATLPKPAPGGSDKPEVPSRAAVENMIDIWRRSDPFHSNTYRPIATKVAQGLGTRLLAVGNTLLKSTVIGAAVYFIRNWIKAQFGTQSILNGEAQSDSAFRNKDFDLFFAGLLVAHTLHNIRASMFPQGSSNSFEFVLTNHLHSSAQKVIETIWKIGNDMHLTPAERARCMVRQFSSLSNDWAESYPDLKKALADIDKYLNRLTAEREQDAGAEKLYKQTAYAIQVKHILHSHPIKLTDIALVQNDADPELKKKYDEANRKAIALIPKEFRAEGGRYVEQLRYSSIEKSKGIATSAPLVICKGDISHFKEQHKLFGKETLEVRCDDLEALMNGTVENADKDPYAALACFAPFFEQTDRAMPIIVRGANFGQPTHAGLLQHLIRHRKVLIAMPGIDARYKITADVSSCPIVIEAVISHPAERSRNGMPYLTFAPPSEEQVKTMLTTRLGTQMKELDKYSLPESAPMEIEALMLEQIDKIAGRSISYDQAQSEHSFPDAIKMISDDVFHSILREHLEIEGIFMREANREIIFIPAEANQHEEHDAENTHAIIEDRKMTFKQNLPSSLDDCFRKYFTVGVDREFVFSLEGLERSRKKKFTLQEIVEIGEERNLPKYSVVIAALEMMKKYWAQYEETQLVDHPLAKLNTDAARATFDAVKNSVPRLFAPDTNPVVGKAYREILFVLGSVEIRMGMPLKPVNIAHFEAGGDPALRDEMNRKIEEILAETPKELAEIVEMICFHYRDRTKPHPPACLLHNATRTYFPDPQEPGKQG